MFFEEVFKHLNKARVDYVVVGGVALVLHGVVRLTADLDLMVQLDQRNLERFVRTIKGLGFRPRVPVEAEAIADPAIREMLRKEKNMEVFSFYHPKQAISLIDVLIYEPVDYGQVKSRALKVKVGRYQIPVISVDDLIKMKHLSGRPQDLADVEALGRIRKDDKE